MTQNKNYCEPYFSCSQYFLLNITHSHVMLPLILWLPLFHHNIVHVPNSKVSCQYWNGRYDVLTGTLKMKKSYLPLHSTTTLNIICESSRKLWQFQNLIIFSCSAMVLWCMIQDLLHVPISFFLIYFFLLSLCYINLNFDCPFNTKVIQTLNDEFKSQKTL